jgi:formate dehydrogenase subunit delta
MANEIATFFASEEEGDGAAVEQVAGHLRRYWEPRMRSAIAAHLASGGAGMTDIVKRAVAQFAPTAT